ncbi:MAG: enoyl-CoA hydratase/isomerase family protein [Candidatus Binatus sp.]|uniref:enoyl-CoA hydratase/isomerase family protein n=1 Tax=Candidatus Binatus sp. TaxID=2811406 RepID=UPI00271F7B36|nr:enoyl-CoA hydratase/isomerase family protein [Candidatus Binatus sp.]MDO8431177.1 enoyl-CoA hydratase/isomerase family protein [Candidatus Binatus sp.]
MAYETVLLDKKDGIAYLTLNRPERANTISAQLAHDVLGAVEDVEADSACRVIIVTGAGERHFCGGADLRDPAVQKGGLGGAAFPRRDFITALETCRVPVIAAINGAAMGGGCEIALACDIRVIADTATIGLPEIRFGALPAGGGTQRLPRLVGAGFAKEMIFSGLPWTAQDAYRVGLVNRVVPAAQLIGACEEMARVFIERAAYALKAAKILINTGVELPLTDALKYERKLIAGMATSDERRQAQQAAAASQATYARIFKDQK